ncbi:DUF6282 family protein, partial [Sutterella sp.]|uniref:DUF6282 family protein n=1 Tax=Sutterella sp. TaxID=1981025 RepID=UPI0026DF23D7
MTESTGNLFEELSDADRARLAGVSDIHIHAAPDSKARLLTETEVARDARAAGMLGVLFKGNDFATHDRAFLIGAEVPGIEVAGGVVMNCCVGERVNPEAVRFALMTTGSRCRSVWMPTLDALYTAGAGISPHSGRRAIPVLDDRGRVLPEVEEVMRFCAESQVIFASGHSSPDETLILARRARELGVAKFVATHVNSSVWRRTLPQMKALLEAGAWLELSALALLWGPGTGLPGFERQKGDEFAAMAALAPERTFI